MDICGNLVKNMIEQSDTELDIKIIKESSFIIISRKLEDDLPVVHVNANIKQFGYCPEDFTSRIMSFSEIIHPDDFKII